MNLVRISALRGKCSCFRLDHPTHLKQAVDKSVIRLDLEDPGKYIWIKRCHPVRSLTRVPALGFECTSPFGHQDADGLAICRSGNLALVAGFYFSLQHHAGRSMPDTILMPRSRAIVPGMRNLWVVLSRPDPINTCFRIRTG